MKNIKYKASTFSILIIVIISLLDTKALMGIGSPSIGWDIINEGLYGQYITADFSGREIGVVLMFIFLILIALIYILVRIYNAIINKEAGKTRRGIKK